MHVRKLASGNYRWIVQHGGRRASGTAPTKGAARLSASAALVKLGATIVRAEGMTVAELLDAWLAERGPDWSPTYAADMARIAHDRIPASMRARDIATVTPPTVAAMHREMKADGVSAHRRSRAHVAISQAFALAVEHGWIDTNPTRDLRGPKVSTAEAQPPSHDTVRALVAAMPERIALVVRLAVVTGARLGELCALRWADLDGDILTIRRTVVHTPASGTVVRDTTKTGRKGDRRLELDPVTVDRLNDHRAAQTVDAVAKMLPTPAYVFSHDLGITPWRPGYVGLEYRRARAKVPGAERVRFHDLRHYVATRMLLEGETAVDVAGQLGHATTATTLRVYAHYLPGRGGEAARRRAATLDD